jgi:fatty-acyl-CoA synthase
MNSDAYVLLWLGCSKAGLVYVPVNFHLTGGELLYILDQSGSRALFYDSQLGANVEEVRDEAGAKIHGTLYDGDELDVVSVAQTTPRSLTWIWTRKTWRRYCTRRGRPRPPRAPR